MARRRVRIVRVRVAAWATVAAAVLALPLVLALGEDPERRQSSNLIIQERVAPLPAPPPSSPVELGAPSTDFVESIAWLRAAGDVDGLLAEARRARTERGHGASRRAVLAIASLGLVSTVSAEEALRGLVLDAAAPSLERTTALAALWERGVAEFVCAQARDSDDPAIRCKARLLQDRRRRSK